MNINDCSKNALLRQYLDELSLQIGKEGLLKLVNGEIVYNTDAPFLSVIMRTRGNRPEALSEVLLCLSGQSDLDFEVLIMGHNLDDNGLNSVNQIIENLPDYMSGKVKLIEVVGGNRTTPLSQGFSKASGRYISILDDDDLVFDNWVEAFHSLENENAGKILHSYCASQDWKISKNNEGNPIMTSVSGFKTIYCQPFEMIEQISVNRCPTFSLAFPSYIYNCLGIRFDESLTTTEDWDFLMRCAFICGVADIPEITGIYRMWTNAESSATLHSGEEWSKNYECIQEKFSLNHLLLPKNELKKLMYNTYSAEIANPKLLEVSVLADDGSGFEAHKPLKLSFGSENDVWTVKCTNIEKYEGIEAIRFDPTENGTVTVKNVSVKLLDKNGNEVSYKINKPRTNGVFLKNKVVFLGTDPQIRFDLQEKSNLSVAEISFEILYGTPKGFFRLGIFKYLAKYWITGIYRKTRTLLRIVKHRLAK